MGGKVNPKKAEAAASKKAAEDAKKSAAEAADWKKGSKDDSKAYVTSAVCILAQHKLTYP